MAKTRKDRDLSEGELIAWIRNRIRFDKRFVKIGPGDDAALVKPASRDLLFTVDTVAEGVDFALDETTASDIGRKALAINLSDLAAMGGRPLCCVASVVLRRGLGSRFSKDLYKGLAAAARRFSCDLVGGDVTGWGSGVVVTVAAVGVLCGKRAITRGGARPGHSVLVTGTLGGSILGKHLKFTPRLAEAEWLARHFPPAAMIDISDGLGVDSGHIAHESAAAIIIDASRVPVSAAARRLAATTGKSALSHAVGDGEDFELLFALDKHRAAKCLEAWPFKTRLTASGRVEKGSGSYLFFKDHHRERIDSEGYQHLRRRRR